MKQKNEFRIQPDGDVLVNCSTEGCPDTWAIIDASQLPKVIDGNGKWCAKKAPVGSPHRYIHRSKIVNGKWSTVTISRHLTSAPPGAHVDHINGETLDNRSANLRVVSPRQNRLNSGKHKPLTSRFKGVYWSKTANKWHVQLRVNGKTVHIGFFASEEEAARRYDSEAIRRYGEFARTNQSMGALNV